MLNNLFYIQNVKLHVLFGASLLIGEDFAFIPPNMANNLLVHKSPNPKYTIKTMSSKSKYCFFPVYTERPKHWFLSLIVKEDKGKVKFFIFDSCPTKMAERLVKETLGPMMREIFEIKNESYIVNVDIPKQMNGDDC